MRGDGGHDRAYQVQITRPFWMGKYEVTQREYEALVGSNPSRWQTGVLLGQEKRSGWWGKSIESGVFLREDTSEFPVEQVSWDDAVAFCALLTAREREAGRLPAGYVFRLPTEAEWEYAARGGAKSQGRTFSGSNGPDTAGWYRGNSGNRPHAVGGKRANELELHDMSGNVWEWCLDWHSAAYYAKSRPADPSGPSTGSRRVYRGGAWWDAPVSCRVSDRDARQTSRNRGIGFRVVLAPLIKPPAADSVP